MSSKVFKSSQLTISLPKTIQVIQDPLVQISESAANLEQVSEENISISQAEEELVNEEVAAQASQILKETEEMVKELMATAREEAERIIAQAREEADRTTKESIMSVNETKQEAYKEGYQKGFDEGQVRAREENENLLQDAQKVVEEAYLEKERIIKSSEQELVKLSSAIARRIIQREVETEPAIIIDIVKEAIRKVNDREELNLAVNPKNLDTLLNVQEELLTSTKGVKKMKVVADPTITHGGCVIETTNGTIDGRVERQLEEIEQSLMDVNYDG